jgi:Zn-dependent metalloprotease
MKSSSCSRDAAAVLSVMSIALVTPACGGGSDSGEIVTQSVRYHETATALAGGDLGVAAPDYARRVADQLGVDLSPSDDMVVISLSDREPDGIRHARLQQTHAGVPVIGSELVVRADDTTFLGLNGFLTSNLDGFDVATSLSAGDATAIAERTAVGTFSGESSRLLILPGDGGRGASLVWEIGFLAQEATRAHLWIVSVDARDGSVRRRYDAIQTETMQASGQGGNAIFSKTWSAELDATADGSDVKFDTDRLQTVDHMTAMPVKGPIDAMPDPVANDAQGYGEITLDMMRDWMGRNSIDDNGMVVVQEVHQNDFCGGACWSAERVHYDDTGYDAPSPGSIDIVGHEINHGFTQFHSNLNYASGTQSAGLNEAFSSVAGIIVRHYEMGDAAGFQLAHETISGGGYVEDLCNPTFRGDYIGDANDWTPDVEVHGAGAPAGRAFCLAVGRYRATAAGGSTTDAVRQIGRIWYQANAAYWTSTADFQTTCEGTVDAAMGLGFSSEVVQALRESWADVGVDCAGVEPFACDNDDSCDVTDGETCATCADDCGACSEDCSFWQKAKCKIGIGDCSNCDVTPGCGDGQCSENETDENCAQDCGCAATDGDCFVAPFGCFCDTDCLEYGDCCVDLANSCQ